MTDVKWLLEFARARFDFEGVVDTENRLYAAAWMAEAVGFGKPRHFHQIGWLEGYWNTYALNRRDPWTTSGASGVFQILPETRTAFSLPDPSYRLWHQLVEAAVVFVRHRRMVERIRPGCCDADSIGDLAMLLHYPRALTFPREAESIRKRTAYLAALAGHAESTDRDIAEIQHTSAR